MTGKGFEISKKKTTEYYENHFKPIEFGKLAGLRDFDRREIACLDHPGRKEDFHRNFHFDSLKKFVEWIPQRAPFKLYFGAVYQRKWSRTIQGIPWQQNELHFDLDVNDSDLMRRGGICDCGKSKKKEERKKICDDCFQIVKEGAIFLIETLDKDFGIKKEDSVIFFSGTRGLHVHYPSVKILGKNEDNDKNIRRNLVEYLKIVKEVEIDDSKMVDGKKKKKVKIVPRVAESVPAITLKKRIESMVYKWFFMRSPENTVKKAKINPMVLKIIQERMREGNTMDGIMVEIVNRDLLTKQRIKHMRESVMIYRYPRYDATPTHDVRKVMKIPGSIDCTTGYIVCKIDDIEGFELSDVDHVSNYITVN